MEAGHCVPYMGGAKEDLVAAHMVNRKRLIEEGVVAVTLEQAGLV
jgi:allophanate hydrolase subunit 1